MIDNDIVAATQLSEQELRVEIALGLYEKGILSFGQARKLAKMDIVEFETLLFDRGIPNPYSIQDLEADLKTLHKWSAP